MEEERCYCVVCGKETACEEIEQFNGLCSECFELEITDMDYDDKNY